MPVETDTGEFLREYLAGRDCACPGCGYNLRDLQTAICPECGQEVVLSVQLVEPRQGALITGLVGLAAGAGLGGLLLIYYVIVSYFYGRSMPLVNRFVMMNAADLAVHGLLLALWLWNWRRIRRWSLRWVLAAACWVPPLLYIVLFSLFIR